MLIKGPTSKPEIQEEPILPQFDQPVEREPIEEDSVDSAPEDFLEDIKALTEKVNSFEKEKDELIKKHVDEMAAVKAAIKKAVYGESKPPTEE